MIIGRRLGRNWFAAVHVRGYSIFKLIPLVLLIIGWAIGFGLHRLHSGGP